MPPSCSPCTSPLPADHPITRSKTRYKGPRPQKTLARRPSDILSFSTEKIQPSHHFTLSTLESRPQKDAQRRGWSEIQKQRHENMQEHQDLADDVQLSDKCVAQKCGSLRKAKDPAHLQDELGSPTQILKGYQQIWPPRRFDEEELSRSEGFQDSPPSPKIAKSPGQQIRSPKLGLRFPHKTEEAATIGSFALPSGGLTYGDTGRPDGKRLHKGGEELKRTISSPVAVESPRGIAKPAFDAPVSAVNAGERRVKVLYDQTLITLPVTPSTTPWEIIRSANDYLTEPVDLHSTILLESFKQLGLERPLRRYEHVRDVLNSWDNDTQNMLLIRPSPTVGRSEWLEIHSVSNSQLVDTSVCIYYSQRPGHWDKRWVTLRSDGQMLVAKREGGETANICHMSDFDIYIPTARQSAKRIRPPRKICFAVKSQQKSSIFLSTANFVHFFSTSDKTLAATWYNAVLEWRSWYLINIMGKGERNSLESKTVSTKADTRNVSDTRFSNPESQVRPLEPPFQRMKARTSTLANHDKERPTPFTELDSSYSVAEGFVGDTPFRSRNEKHSLQSKEITKDANPGTSREQGPSFRQVMQSIEPEPFAATGLLGRTYTQRQKAQREREKAQKAGSDQPAATPIYKPAEDVNRKLTQQLKPKPLIDLTPQYQEPLQHARKGRGVILEQIPAGGLVEVANTPEAAIAIPPSTTWRRPRSLGKDRPNISRSKTMHRDHRCNSPLKSTQTPTSPNKGNMVLTNRLVAITGRGQVGTRPHQGIMSGDRQAKEPTLSIGEERQYAPGSLLERVQIKEGGVHLISGGKKKRMNSGEGT